MAVNILVKRCWLFIANLFIYAWLFLYRFSVENEEFGDNKELGTLLQSITSKKKLIVESFSY